jgi:hypothetical protein
MTEAHRDSILQYIRGAWDDYDQQRYENISDPEFGHARAANQRIAVMNLEDDLAMGAGVLRDLILRGKLLIMDKENCIPWPASGLFITQQGEICVFHER